MTRFIIALAASTTLLGACCPDEDMEVETDTNRPDWADDLGPRPTDMWGDDTDTDATGEWYLCDTTQVNAGYPSNGVVEAYDDLVALELIQPYFEIGVDETVSITYKLGTAFDCAGVRMTGAVMKFGFRAPVEHFNMLDGLDPKPSLQVTHEESVLVNAPTDTGYSWLEDDLYNGNVTGTYVIGTPWSWEESGLMIEPAQWEEVTVGLDISLLPAGEQIWLTSSVTYDFPILTEDGELGWASRLQKFEHPIYIFDPNTEE